MSIRKHIVHEAVLDNRDGTLWLDGVALPFWLQVDPEVDAPTEDTPMGAVRVGFWADNITVIGKAGERTHPAVADHTANMDWARRRGCEIVRTGLAPWLQYLGEAP